MTKYDIIFQSYLNSLKNQQVQNSSEVPVQAQKPVQNNFLSEFNTQLNLMVDLIDKLDQYYNPWLNQPYEGLKILKGQPLNQEQLKSSKDIITNFIAKFKKQMANMQIISRKAHKRWTDTQLIPFRYKELQRLIQKRELESNPYLQASGYLNYYKKRTKENQQTAERIESKIKPDMTKRQVYDLLWDIGKNHSSFKDHSRFITEKMEQVPVWFSESSEIGKAYDASIKKLVQLRAKLQQMYDAKEKQMDDFAQKTEITPQIRKKYFRNYGYMNGWTEETYDKYSIAERLHKKDIKEHPELHHGGTSHPYNCVEKYECSCGLGYAVDSSD